jgi:hypothetical protein
MKGCTKKLLGKDQKESRPVTIEVKRPIPKQEAQMKFSTEAISKMAEIMVSEMRQIG